jgi:hypothetical protein
MITTLLWMLLLLALMAVPAVVGILRRGASRPDWLAVAGAAVVGVVFGVLGATTDETGVSTEDSIKGVMLAFAVGAVPVYGLFVLGRALAGRRVVLGITCAALTVPLAYMYFVGWMFVLDLVHCPPDAYECPL